MERGEPSWHARSTEPMSIPSSSDAVATMARTSPFWSRRSASSRTSRARAAVVGQHRVVRKPLAQHVGQPLGHPPGVDENQRGVVGLR